MSTRDKLSGYPSIDKPHEQFYRKTPIRRIETTQTIYELVFNSNQENMTEPALEYLGVVWSFEKLKNETDRAASAFAKSGLKLGDTVLIGVSNSPEAVVTLLALNKLGVVSKWFDVRAGEKDIEDYANESNCRYLIALDLLLPKIQLILDNTKLEKVLIIRPTDSLSKAAQIAYSIKSAISIPADSRYVHFKDFVKTGKGAESPACVPFDKNRPSIMIQSSGTTGKPKRIVHSDFSATSYANSICYCDIPIEPRKKLLNLLPPWIAYALGGAIIYPLVMATKVILSPTFEPEEIMKYIGKFTISVAAPFHYRYLHDNFDKLSVKQKNELYRTECLVSGGDKITVEENAAFEKLFRTVLINGYGNNEGWGCLTCNSVLNNRYGSVGLPKPGETIIAYDTDAEKELPYGESGEICVLANTMFLYYEGNAEETNAVKRLHPDGKTWLHTGDLGFIDEDGFVTLNGRARRVIVRRGFKISAYTIEDKISEHPAVKECVAVEVSDVEDEHVPMAYIILREDAGAEEEVKNSIYEKCRRELKEYEIPKYFRIVSALPYTQNGKYDFRLLEEQGNEFVDMQG